MAYPTSLDSVDFSMGTCPMPGKSDVGGINEMLVCTYDESHLVSGGRYCSHIEQCRKAFIKKDGYTDLRICPYHRGHHVHFSVLDKHIAMCDGYYKKWMNDQEDPQSMESKYDRYKVTPIVSKVGDKDTDTYLEPDEVPNENASAAAALKEISSTSTNTLSSFLADIYANLPGNNDNEPQPNENGAETRQQDDFDFD